MVFHSTFQAEHELTGLKQRREMLEDLSCGKLGELGSVSNVGVGILLHSTPVDSVYS